MFLDLQQIQDEALAVDARVAVRLPALRTGDPSVVGTVAVVGQARRGSEGVELRAAWNARVRVECSRCLEPMTLDLAECFLLILVADSGEGTVEPERQMRAEDAAFFPVEGDRADVGSILAEQIQLALPLKPVCGDGCAGLCPTCGANRNRIECGCPRAEVDPRLAPLLELKRRLGGDGD